MELIKIQIESNIVAKEQPIYKVFSNEYFFEIPRYQRPYSWKTEQVEELIEDLGNFAFQDEKFENLKPYFLGSIVLIRGEKHDVKVIDGQQRLITLTILFSVMRELLSDSDESVKSITKRIHEEGDYSAGIKGKFRIALRSKDQDFFNTYIQLPGGINKIPLEKSLQDSQDNIRKNALCLKKKLGNQNEYPRDKIDLLIRYIVQKCLLVVVSTSDEESAYRIFTVLNNRGLPLSHADILKAEIIGEIHDSEEEDVYAKKWEDKEVELGIDQFRDLFSHIRMINRKVKAKDTILKEIRDYIKPKERPKEFIDNKLIPYAEAFYDVKNASFESNSNAEKINYYFGCLNRLDNEDWIPPVISYLGKWGNRDTERVVEFLKKLERLSFGLHVLRKNINSRIDKYGKILSAIEIDDLVALESSLSLSDEECKDIINAIDRDIYGKQFARYLLLRLDAELPSEGEVFYNHKIISIEHVLPQNPDENSEWARLFDEYEREDLTNCLGNLVLLSRKKNSSAKNYDFNKKKFSYFKQEGVTPFNLTTDVLTHDQWTHNVICKRQKDLLNKCKNIWDLGDGN